MKYTKRYTYRYCYKDDSYFIGERLTLTQWIKRLFTERLEP